MTLASDKKRSNDSRFASDEQRWQAIVDRDPAADGAFYYSVKTTGVYCRPVCAARLALRHNVRFHASCEDAEQAGFRPCKRCQPDGKSLAERQAVLVARACRILEEFERPPSLTELAQLVGISGYHLHRLFQSQTGVTPRAYAAAQRARRMSAALTQRQRITSAIYDAGFGSNRQFYETAQQDLGMSPKTYRAGGKGLTIRFAVGECWLGSILVAATEQGVCSISLGDRPDELVRELQDQFPNAELVGGDRSFEAWVATVVGFVADPDRGLDLPLDIRGTAFQITVWNALCEIPPGTTATYSEIAARIGQPKSVRAVARACASNRIAVAIPCHRVVRTDGALSGYRWGVDRKAQLLDKERIHFNDKLR